MTERREIPSGTQCDGCSFENCDTEGSIDWFNCVWYEDEGGESRNRLAECILDYPYGGVITVEPKDKP